MKKDFKKDLLSPSDFTELPIQIGDKVENIGLIRVNNYPKEMVEK